MSRTLIFSQILLLFLFTHSCTKEPIEDPQSKPVESRSFFMGFTAFPYDLSLIALAESFESVNKNGDIVLAHFDNGVPWEEALNDKPFPIEIQNSLTSTKQELTPGNKLVLTATATSTERNKLAGNWNNNGSNEPLKFPWTLYSFDDEVVIKAYLKYCKRIIDEVNPDYFGYGIEINASFVKGSKAFNDYIVFAEAVYKDLKETYPTLPIFLSFQDQSFNKSKSELLEVTRTLLPFTDIIALSTYPYWMYDHPTRDANPDHIDENWMSEIRNLDPSKPFVISETGYCAEDMNLDEVNVSIKGNSEWQEQYATKLFDKANKLNAEFIIWFVYRDYDQLYEAVDDPPFIFKVWKDIGLKDGDGNKRKIHNTWDKWLSLPLN